MTMPDATTPVAPITATTMDELPLIDPDQSAPPLVAQDGHHSDVGAAHGRVLPMVGQWRPYLLDVDATSITKGHTRIYADTADDAVAVLVGGEAATAIAELHAAMDELGVDPAPESALSAQDLLLVGDSEEASEELAAVEELVPETQRDYDAFAARRQRLEDAQMRVAALLTDHATGMRLQLQRTLNAAAVDNSQWERLDADEQDELTACATDGAQGRRPFGIPEEAPFFHEDGTEAAEPIIRGEWRADVPLVCLRTDYLPFTGTVSPLSVVTSRTEDGLEFWAPGEPNLVWLDPSNPADYLESLREAGLVEITERPVDHAVEVMRPWLKEKRRRDLEQARAAAKQGEQ